MKSKLLFWILVIIVFGGLFALGLLFFKTDIRLFLIIEGVAVLAVILFISLYMRLIRPYQLIASGMELLNEQDFSSRLRPVDDSEANKLVGVFNRMMDQLKNERLRVREKNHFLDLLINASPQGVLILDFNERITDVNPAGLHLLHIGSQEEIMGKKLKELDISFANQLSALKAGEDVVIRGSGITLYRCSRSSFVDRGFDHPFILIEELTHELLKIEKESYERIIRMMSHEVNNSVGAIGSTLNVISDILNQDETNELNDVQLVVKASSDRCKHLGCFISDLADVVKIPKPSFSDVKINELVKSVEALTSVECQKRNIKLTLKLSEKNEVVKADGIQMEQVLVNVVKNAYESIGRNGEIHIVTKSSPATIIVEDNGAGISEEVKQNLFTPFFTTKTEGQGIGLMFVREVLMNHGCDFSLDSEDNLTSFQIVFLIPSGNNG